jgi:aralkylamine N-acetyltransferase
MKTPEIVFVERPHGIDWVALRSALKKDGLDHRRTAAELRDSFHHSRHVCFARQGDRVIGTGRLLSDGISDAFLVDVWVSGRHRRRGIASHLVALLLRAVPGQQVHLQTDDPRLYAKLGFRPQPGGMSIVAGPRSPRRS